MLTIAWLIDTARRTFAKMFGSAPGSASQTMSLRSGGNHGYTVLGAAISRRATPDSVEQRAPARVQAANDLSDR
jgi:hypothetical protein